MTVHDFCAAVGGRLQEAEAALRASEHLQGSLRTLRFLATNLPVSAWDRVRATFLLHAAMLLDEENRLREQQRLALAPNWTRGRHALETESSEG